jgi:pimeloyl-ACP methyl ester carboxylesterase
MTTEFTTITNGEISLRVALQGDGPLILCIHGWPELWYSWRHQMEFFSERGFRVAAMDVRGYGGSSKPTDIPAYTLAELCGDAAAVIDGLSDGPAIVFGHDWGAPVAWNTARLHPDKVRAVAGLSVPYVPVGSGDPLDHWRDLYTSHGKFFYQVYFADNEGRAEAALAEDNLVSLRKIYFALSGETRGQPFLMDKSADLELLDGLVDPQPFPAWATDADLQVYVDAIERGGWHGPLHRYRAQALDAEQVGALPDPNIKQPAAFIGGEFDVVRDFNPGIDIFALASMACDNFRGTTIIDGVGHWVQQEAPVETNRALLAFVESL